MLVVTDSLNAKRKQNTGWCTHVFFFKWQINTGGHCEWLSRLKEKELVSLEDWRSWTRQAENCPTPLPSLFLQPSAVPDIWAESLCGHLACCTQCRQSEPVCGKMPNSVTPVENYTKTKLVSSAVTGCVSKFNNPTLACPSKTRQRFSFPHLTWIWNQWISRTLNNNIETWKKRKKVPPYLKELCYSSFTHVLLHNFLAF